MTLENENPKPKQNSLAKLYEQHLKLEYFKEITGLPIHKYIEFKKRVLKDK